MRWKPAAKATKTLYKCFVMFCAFKRKIWQNHYWAFSSCHICSLLSVHVVWVCVLEKKISSVEHLALSYAGLKLKCCDSRKCTCEQGSNVLNVLLPTIHRSLTDMALELPASRNFQIIGMALATVTLGAPGTRTARLKQSAVKWTEQILEEPFRVEVSAMCSDEGFPFLAFKAILRLVQRNA